MGSGPSGNPFIAARATHAYVVDMARSDRLIPHVSVIVPVRNGRDDLRRLIEALSAQTMSTNEFELVIADDGSTDGSTEGLETQHSWIRVEPGLPRNSYAARNRAVRAARGSILAFCDADCRPEPEWLERGLAALEGADLVAGRIRFDVPQRRTVWTLLDMDSSKDHEREVPERNRGNREPVSPPGALPHGWGF